MENFSEAHSPEKMGKDDTVVYVEQLTAEHDYWLSITDAARVCRVQDVSIRRAITKGSLPVRRQRAGQNKRTRFVRASDLPLANFPIIDESAAITTEIGKVDILSIPRQQQQIMHDHQHVLAGLAETQEILVKERIEVQSHFRQHEEEFQLALRTLQLESAQQLAEVAAVLAHKQENLQQDLVAAEQQRANEQQTIQHYIMNVQADIRQHETRYQALLLSHQAEVQEMLNEQKSELHLYQKEAKLVLEALATAQQEAFLTYQHAVNTQVQRIEQDTLTAITLCQENIMSKLDGYKQTTEVQLSGLVNHISLVQQAAESVRQDGIAQRQEWEQVIQQQQTQIDLHAQLIPLLPYVGQRLVTEPMVSQWNQELVALEMRLATAHKEELAGDQPLLAFLRVPGRLEALERLLAEDITQTK
ncbi:MAG: hypothetical protein ABI234_02835 [Ktedonobacteraceae bacterium]